MPQGKKSVPQQGNRKLKKNLHQSQLEGKKHQSEIRNMEVTMKEKDACIEELRASLTKREAELNQVREVALDFKEVVSELQTQNGKLQNMASDKLTLMVELEKNNSTLKKQEDIVKANVS